MSNKNRNFSICRVLTGLLVFPALVASGAALASNGISVTVPNGYARIATEDMNVQSPNGAVRLTRTWDGQEWKFNPQWESLSLSWKNLTGSEAADTTGSTLGTNISNGGANSSSGGNGGCWVWVDEDWSPSVGTAVIGGIAEAGPMLPERTTPFNRFMGDATTDYLPPTRVNIDYATLCAGVSMSASVTEFEGIRRQNELYLGESGRYAFSNRAVIEKRAVRQIQPVAANVLVTQLATGSMSLNLVTNDKGYRWIHKEGDWIDYDTKGQVVAYGDKNDNAVWMVRDTSGVLRGVLDDKGRVIYTFFYNGGLLTEVRDAPINGNGWDLPTRSVKYQYDDKNRLTQVTDVRGNTIKYEYDVGNHITKITDQEGRSEQIVYGGDTVVKRIAADGAVTDYVFEYDDTNKQFVSKITGPETEAGRRVQDYTHNRVGKLVRQVVNGRTDIEVQYDTGARTEIETNARGFTTRLTRNEFDQIVQMDKPDGTVRKSSYSVLNLQLIEETDESGFKTQYQYDAKGNPVKKIEAAGTPDERITEYQVNNLGQITYMAQKGRTEASGALTPDAIWRIEYDALGQINKTIDPEGNIRQYMYDRAGYLTQITDPLGHTTRYEVDADGNLLKVIDALGHSRGYEYDRVGNLTRYTDERGKATQAAYDALNRRTQTINPVGGIYQTQYNGQGLPVSAPDADGRTSRAEFDNFLRLTKQVDGLGNVTQHGYQVPDGSGVGQLGTLIYPTQVQYPTFTQQTRYDALERPTSETLLNPSRAGTEGLVSSTSYDARGLVKTETDAYGKTQYYDYDGLRQLIAITDALGNKTRVQYDARGNPLQIVEAGGNVTRFSYDRNNRVVKEVLPLGQNNQYTYDAAGNLAERTDLNSNRSVFTYDAANRLTQVKRYNKGGNLQRTTSYAWDAAGNLTDWSDTDHVRSQTSTASATFDDDNRLTGESITYPGGYVLSYSYGYSADGKKVRLTWPDGTVINYGYSDHGELESIAIPGEGAISVNQFKWTAPLKVTLPGGTTEEKSYDGLLNLEGIKVKTAGQQTLLEMNNSYGKVQELKTSSRNDVVNGGSSAKDSSYTYDDATQLTQAVVDTGGLFGTDTESFTLDAVGNRIAYSQVNGAWQYDANNRLIQRGTGDGATRYEYDDAGNLIKKIESGNKITQYAYDVLNRLIEVRDGSNNLISRYGYDSSDRRLWKEQFRDRDGNALSQAKRTFYLYAEEGLIAESEQDIALDTDQNSVSNDVPHITVQYGPVPDSEFTTQVLFVKTKNSNDQDTIAYFHRDQIDAPIQATDKAGHVVWSASYNVFGQAQITTPLATTENPTITFNLRLPGQYYDSETGFHYNWHRYYDSVTGRYIQSDPIGLAAGINRYVYANSNPLMNTDPEGLLSAADLPSLPQGVVNAAAGVGDGMLTIVSLGTWNGPAVRKRLGINSVDSCTNEYMWGKVGGEVVATLILMRAKNPCNSFTAETLVHVRPVNVDDLDAHQGKTILRRISQLKVGDEVLAMKEWENEGNDQSRDTRLSYEKISDIFTSIKQQTLVHLTFESGETLTATDGHPFKTSEGWRAAILLKKGTKLLLKSRDGMAERTSTVVDVYTEQKVLRVFNLEVENAHTFFVGEDGNLVHNAKCKVARQKKELEDLLKKGHKKKTPSKREKHEKGDERRGKDKGGEKKDPKMPY